MSSSTADPTALADLLHALPPRSQRLLALASQQWDRRRGLLVFAYGSLIWKPGFSALERWPAAVHGYHRALRLRSLVNRGSRTQPGLVLTLLSGGSCRGLLYRVAPAHSQQVLEALWAREMVVGSYDPRWLDCRTPAGSFKGLSFTLSRKSPGYVGAIADAELLHILRHAQGRYGSTLDYLARSVAGLREHGIHDHEMERQLALAMAHGLLPAGLQEAPVG